MPGERIRFNCGEFLPGNEPIPGGGGVVVPTVPPIYVPTPPPPRPRPPFPPVDVPEWVCICERPCNTGGMPDGINLCMSPADRRCIQTRDLPRPSPPRTIKTYSSKAQCEAKGFGEKPCLICGVECRDVRQIDCPPNTVPQTAFVRNCVVCPPRMFQPPECRFKSVVECNLSCRSTACVTPQTPTTGGGTPPIIVPPAGGFPGTITPRRKWRCESKREYCPQDSNLPENQRRLVAIKKGCKECDQPLPGTPWGPGCDFTELSQCQSGCRTSPITGNPCVTPPNRGPITGTPPEVIAIPTPVTPTGRRPEGSIQVVVTSTPNTTSTGQPQLPVVTSNPAGTVGQRPQEPIIIATPIRPVGQQPNEPTPILTTPAGLAPRQTQVVVTSFPTNPTLGSNENSVVVTPAPIATILSNIEGGHRTKTRQINVSLEGSEQSVSGDSSSSRTRGLYHPEFNFFNTDPSPNTSLVTNNVNTSIFNASVTKEIRFFLDNANSLKPWNEYVFQDLTLDKIALSLNPQLLAAFNNIHILGGTKVNVESFLSMVRRLLVTGRIDDLDPVYYIDLADKQKDDEIVEFIRGENQEVLKQASLGVISKDASGADFTEYDSIFKNLLKRQKRLNTDINASVQVTQFSGSIDTVPLADYGMDIELLDNGISAVVDGFLTNLNIGSGAGYYLPVYSFDIDDDMAVSAYTDISAAYYVPPGVRYNALTILGIDQGIKLRARSQSGVNEFTDVYSPSADLSPQVYVVDFSSIGDMDRPNSLVDSISATYRLVTDQELINQYVIDYALNTSKINIDHQDPILHYITDSSSVDLTQFDITFRSFYHNRTSVDQSILTRNIPLLLIITPGNGTYHNPFAGRSYITQFDGDYVYRELQFLPDINISDKSFIKPPLEEISLYDQTGKYYVGALERDFPDPQNISYQYATSASVFSKSYYEDGVYTTTQPDNRPRSAASHLVLNVVDYLIDTYAVSDLTWWDVFRRMSTCQIGELSYDVNKSFYDRLAGEWRGVPIRDVLARLDKRETGIQIDLLDTDITYVNLEDRLNAKNN